MKELQNAQEECHGVDPDEAKELSAASTAVGCKDPAAVADDLSDSDRGHIIDTLENAPLFYSL